MRKSWFSRISLLYVTALLLTGATAAPFSLKPAKLSVSPQAAATQAAPATPAAQPAAPEAPAGEREPLTRGPAVRTVTEDANAVRTYTVDSFYMTFKVEPATGKWELQEKLSNTRGGEIWSSGEKGFGEVTYQIDDRLFTAELKDCEVAVQGRGLKMTFRPVAEIADMNLSILAMLSSDQPKITFTVHPARQLDIVSIKLMDGAFPLTSEDVGAGVLVPARAGMFVPADSGKTFAREFGDSAYEGCHIRLWGFTKNNTAAFLTWDDSYTSLGLKSEIDSRGKQTLSTSIIQKKNPRGFSFYACGKGDYNEIASVYKSKVAEKAGFYVPWSVKTGENSLRKNLWGATNFKLWSVLDRKMDEAGQTEKYAVVNWTFEEAGKVAEHLKNDLRMDDVLFSMGGWIHKGYDNQHPDILPAAPECGGNWELRKAVWAIQNAGFTACLHDNYQDMYKNSPSWDEKYLSKNPDQSIRPGGVWNGGRAYITCSKAAIDLAKRPQNLPEVLKITQARAYFIDTTYAAGPMECYDRAHPIDYDGDIYWRSTLSDYARDLFGIFGSEDGREWAIPHADFFEGITGVAGNAYHTYKIEEMGATLVPVFEMIYHDTIAAYGKYGYDQKTAAPFVLRHITQGRPLYHHSVPSHLYWQGREKWDSADAALAPEAVYTRSEGGWTAGMHPFDVFVKNTHEILSPLNKLTAEMSLTRFDFLTRDRNVARSVFQGEGKTVIATVNYGVEPYRSVSIMGEDFQIPQYGFVIESGDFVAFNASLYNGVEYPEPVLFTLRSLDGKPVWNSAQVQVFHGFGSPLLKIAGKEYTVERDSVISTAGSGKQKTKTAAAEPKASEKVEAPQKPAVEAAPVVAVETAPEVAPVPAEQPEKEKAPGKPTRLRAHPRS